MSVSYETAGGVAIARLDDGKVNALTPRLIADLREAVASASAAETPLVVVGRPGRFSAGFDLSVLRGDDPDAAVGLLLDGQRLYEDLVRAPVPVIVACTGHALAAGALLLLSADHRIGSPSPAKIGLNEVRIGMALPRFAVTLVHHRIAPHLSSAVALGEVADPGRAKELGFLDALADDPLAAATKVAEDHVALGPAGLAAFATTKRRLREPLCRDLGLAAGLDAEDATGMLAED